MNERLRARSSIAEASDRFRIVLADPPWLFNGRVPGLGRPVTRTKNIRSTFEAAVGEHSEKPATFYASSNR